MFKRKAEGDAGEQPDKMGSADDRKATFARNLTALNSQFASWVADQRTSAARELWTDGVEDYLKYAKQLLAQFKDVLEGAEGGKPEEAAAPSGSSGGNLFGHAAAAPPTAPPPGSTKPPLAPSGGLFGGGSGGAASAPASIFGALPSTSGAFGAGGSAPAFGGFGAGSAANSGSGMFTVPSTGTLGSSFTGTGAAGGEEADEEGDEQQDDGPSVQLALGDGTELLAEQRVKLLSMGPDKKWKDKGQGRLTLRRATGDDAASKRPYLVFTAGSGRTLINAPLMPNMKPTAPPKVPTALIMFLINTVDGATAPGTHMFKCDSPELAKQLLQLVAEAAADVAI